MKNAIVFSLIALTASHLAAEIPTSHQLLTDGKSFDRVTYSDLVGKATAGKPEAARADLVGGTLAFYQTDEGRSGKLQVIHRREQLVVRYATFNHRGEVLAGAKQLVLKAGDWVDLDLGKVSSNPFQGADLGWQSLAGGAAITSHEASLVVARIPIFPPLPDPPGGGGGGGGGDDGGGGSTPDPDFTHQLHSISLSRSLLATGLDQDQDGLDDDMENQLAEKVRPYYLFDSAENSRRSYEPITVFQVRPDNLCLPGGKLKVVIRWVFLFYNDGGYGPNSWCDDSHRGDNDIASFYLESTDGGSTWNLTAVVLGGGTIAWPHNINSLLVYRNTHPVIYQSAHKHHLHLDTSYDHRDSPYSAWGCNEDVNGLGDSVFADIQSLHNASDYNNVGEPAYHGSPFANNFGPYYVVAAPGVYYVHDAWTNRDFYEVGPTRDKWLTYDFAASPTACECDPADWDEVLCVTPGGQVGFATAICNRGLWVEGACQAGEMP